MHPSLKIYDEAVKGFINTDFEILTLVADCEFTEGPVWNKEGFYLFSDIDANTIYKITEGEKKQVYISNSGTNNPNAEGTRPDHAGSNALTYDNNGTLLVCQHGDHTVAKWDGKNLQPLIHSYKGRPFNSPNDLIVDKLGRVFFSDPPYGLKDAEPAPEKFQPVAAVYCWNDSEVIMVCDKYEYPNGVCITPDSKELYVCSNKPSEEFISVYDVETLQYKKILAKENSDGIKCDPAGHVYLCNKDGIIVINADGQRMALIEFPTIPANCCWGGAALKDLMVTARENVFLIKNLLK